MSYIHHIPGRIRIRIEALKRDRARAATLERWLKWRKGVDRVDINPLTGSVLIYYKTVSIDANTLIGQMREAGWIGPAAPQHTRSPRTVARPAIQRTVAKAIVSYLAEAALERSVIALAAAIL